MAQESSYRKIYYDTFLDFAEKQLGKELAQSQLNLNFGPDSVVDGKDETGHKKSKYHLQGANPLKLLRKLEKEIANRRVDPMPRYDLSPEHMKACVQESLSNELCLWQLISECVGSDYIHFEFSKLDELPEESRTPNTLLAQIMKSDHEILSCYSILRWLEKNYDRPIRMPNDLTANCQGEDLVDQGNMRVKEPYARFLFEQVRSGRVGQVKDRCPPLIKAWKTSLLHGTQPSLGEIVDPIGCDIDEFKNPMLATPEGRDDSNCNYSNGAYFTQMKMCKEKSEAELDQNRQNKYELALYGAFCGNCDALSEVCVDWSDDLWSQIKTILFYQVTTSYLNQEEEYLELYNLTNADYHNRDSAFKEDFEKWRLPDKCPADFDHILRHVSNNLPNPKIAFPNREENPFHEVMILLLQLQLKLSKMDRSKNRWNLVVEKLYELNDMRKFDDEDMIFLRFSVHFLILLYILKRIDASMVQKYNEVLLKYIDSEEDIEHPLHTFYLNFIIGDEAKVEYYSQIVCKITDEKTQMRILANIDTHLPHLKPDLVQRIRDKIVNGENQPSRSGSNIAEVAKKLKWIYEKENYTAFYRSVLEIARSYLMNDFYKKVDSLYRELKEELDCCEQAEPLFQEDGIYRLLTVERQKHQLLIQIKDDFFILETEGSNPQACKSQSFAKRLARLAKNIDKLLKDRPNGVVLFDFPIETDCSEKVITDAHSVLKCRYVPDLVKKLLTVLKKQAKFEECLKFMDYVLDKQDDDMQVDILDTRSKNQAEGALSLKPYLDQEALRFLDFEISEVMMQTPEIVEFLLS